MDLRSFEIRFDSKVTAWLIRNFRISRIGLPSDVRSRDQVSSRDGLETGFRGLGLGLGLECSGLGLGLGLGLEQ